MAISVRMAPLLEKELELAAKRQGLTKSQFVIDAVERALGRKDPYQLLQQVREEFAEYRTSAAAPLVRPGLGDAQTLSTSERLRAKLKTQHDADTRDWAVHQNTNPLVKTAKPGARDS